MKSNGYASVKSVIKWALSNFPEDSIKRDKAILRWIVNPKEGSWDSKNPFHEKFYLT